VQATVAAGDIDLILLDWMLPGMDGLSLCRALRASSDIPIIMMTARARGGPSRWPRQRRRRLHLQALQPARSGGPGARGIAPPPIRHPQPGLQIDDQGMRAYVHGKELALTPVEFRLLKMLRAAPGNALSRDDLRSGVYEDRRIVHDRTIDTHVKNLRRKLEEAGLVEAISAVYGVGYRWEARSALQP
jgi:two-component system response regulator BaeR